MSSASRGAEVMRVRAVGGNEPGERQREVGRVLATLPEDWERALAVVAHPNDLEYGRSACSTESASN